MTGTHRTVTRRSAEYRQVAAESRRTRLVATVRRLVRSLGDAQLRRLGDGAGAASTASTVHLNVVVDPDLIGGMRVEIGDDVIDGTIVQPPRRRPTASSSADRAPQRATTHRRLQKTDRE